MGGIRRIKKLYYFQLAAHKSLKVKGPPNLAALQSLGTAIDRLKADQVSGRAAGRPIRCIQLRIRRFKRFKRLFGQKTFVSGDLLQFGENRHQIYDAHDFIIPDNQGLPDILLEHYKNGLIDSIFLVQQGMDR